MTQHIRFYTLVTIIALVLSACTIWSTPTPTPQTPGIGEPIPTTTPVPAMSMVVSYDTTISYDTVDQEVNYIYVIENTSTTPLPGPLTVTDDRVTVTCPGLESVGNGDASLDVGESITCTGPYKITQLDLNAGSFTNTATASAGENFSSAVTATVTVVQTKALTLTASANPQTYKSVDEQVIYTYTVKNTGNVTLGPAQFTITDSKFADPFICGSEGASLAPNETATCSRTYTVTQADLDARSVTSNATVTDGTTTSPSTTTIINKDTTSNLELVADPNLAKGSTISHHVVKGEWLWQIARCYGADPRQTVRSNPQLSDPAKIDPGITVSVPNIGSERIIYGPQIGDDQVKSCVPAYEVQSGDTWENIAERFKASPSLLREVNSVTVLSPGIKIRVPINSVGD